MKRKNLMLTVAAAAVLGAFNPAFAGGGAQHGSADDTSSPPRAEQGASASTESSTSGSTESSPSAATESSATESVKSENSAQGGTALGATPSSGDEQREAKKEGYEPDRLTGLDQAHPAN